MKKASIWSTVAAIALSVILPFVIIAVVAILIFFLPEKKPEPVRFEMNTELGDHLNVEVELLEHMHHSALEYKITSPNCEGMAMLSTRDWRYHYQQVPDNVSEFISTIGKYGKTNFYGVSYNIPSLFDESGYEVTYNIFYVYDGTLIDDLERYIPHEAYDGIPDENEAIRIAVLEDLMKTADFSYISKYGEMLAYYRSEPLHNMLLRYADGNFTENELLVNQASRITAADMASLAGQLLEKYYG